eukprot:TRINITY_DN10405_c0_g1_i10.p1 TRINITY_DN10405_c0_g1~~TRINITY_DN10405_c0_g1_i10.p1  ORF type:complete len:515 (-),score=107.39 TRINITY_DN10405_c0_g1_i10:534-2021(-)
MDSSLNKSSSFQSGFNPSMNLSIPGTSSGYKRPGDFLSRTTPSKITRKSPGRVNLTPGRDVTPGRKTPGDRFIPNRSAMNLEASYHKLMKETLNDSEVEMQSPGKREYQRVLQENLNVSDPSTTRVLSFNAKVNTSNSYLDSLKILSSASKEPHASKKTVRIIPQSAERILDAPDFIDDYYLNVVDWSANNHLAVALDSTVYIWNANNGAITPLFECTGGEYISSLRWIPGGGEHLAVGLNSGQVQLWDVAQAKRSRVMAVTADSSRVASLAWNQYILSSGCRSGSILHSDVRVANHMVAASNQHTQEVCGLVWSPDGKYLASGGNDNLVCVWSGQGGQCFAGQQPNLVIREHQSAVRAVAWCPWQPAVLATGGGASCRAIKIWNCNSGKQVTSLDTKSQVCSLVWNENYHELVSSHGHPHFEINLWKYPAMKKVGELKGHTGRVLQLCQSPDTSTLLSAGADETLRLWNLFPIEEKKKEAKKKESWNALTMGMR